MMIARKCLAADVNIKSFKVEDENIKYIGKKEFPRGQLSTKRCNQATALGKKLAYKGIDCDNFTRNYRHLAVLYSISSGVKSTQKLYSSKSFVTDKKTT